VKIRTGIKTFIALTWMALLPLARHSQEATSDDSIAIIGLDQEGQAVTKWVPKKIWNDHLLGSLNAVQDSLRPSLLRLDENAYIKNNESFKAWELRTIAIGVGLNAQFGLGPLFSVTLSPKFKLIFSNSRNPVYPD